MKILVINAGSSSLKYQLIDPDSGEVFAKGLCERIGIDGRLNHKVPATGQTYEAEIPMPTHNEATQAMKEALLSKEHGVIADMSEIDAVGHRVVHAGDKFTGRVIVTDEMIEALREHIFLAPLHTPAHIDSILAAQKIMPGVPMVGVFDTGFYDDMPEHYKVYAMPYEYYESDMVRRYGYHGTSHRYIARRTAEIMGKPVEDLKIVSCHLGNGSSVVAVDGGKAVDCSLGMSAMSGLPMGTRSGDVDPGVMEFIMTKYDLDINQMMEILNRKSGVKGVSGVSNDFRDLQEAAQAGNHRAALALDIFHYIAKKYIGSYAAAMGGLDVLVFTAGIGENAIETRMAIASGLEFLGIKMDPEANNVRGKEAVLSTPDSRVKVLLVPTNEELMIAIDTAALITK